MSKNKKKQKKNKDKLWHFFVEIDEFDKMRQELNKENKRLKKNYEHFYKVAGEYQTNYREMVEELIMIREYIDTIVYSMSPICNNMEDKYLKKIDKSKKSKNEKKRF